MKIVLPYINSQGEALNGESVNNTLEFTHKGNGVFEALVPIAFAGNRNSVKDASIRQVKMTVTSQTMQTKNGISRSLIKVEIPYTSIDSDGAYVTKGSITAHTVISLPKSAINDFNGVNGDKGRALAIQQLAAVRALERILSNSSHDIEDTPPLTVKRVNGNGSSAKNRYTVAPVITNEQIAPIIEAIADDMWGSAPSAHRCVLAEGRVVPEVSYEPKKAMPSMLSGVLYCTDLVPSAGGTALWINASDVNQVSDPGQMAGVRSLFARIAAGMRPVTESDTVASTAMLVTWGANS